MTGDEAAFPTRTVVVKDEIVEDTKYFTGLTKREYFAGLAMQGLINGITEMDEIGIIENRPKDIAELSCLYADTLLSELAKRKEE